MYTEMEKLVLFDVLEPAKAGSFFRLILHINEEWEISGRQKVVRESNVQALTSHASLNPRSKRASSLDDSQRLVMANASSPNHSALRLRSPPSCWLYLFW